MIDPRLHDSAKDILSNAPLDDETRADAWDSFHSVRTAQELSGRLANMNLPSDVAESLIQAKKLSEPEAPPALAAIQHLATIDPEVLDRAEKYPNVLRHLVQAIQSGE
jgi:hypothetical protein